MGIAGAGKAGMAHLGALQLFCLFSSFSFKQNVVELELIGISVPLSISKLDGSPQKCICKGG